tara:strand:- start:70 stop:1398 length:1329 start_codon:yes stop_codon:yes gene_type:complete
MIMAVFDARLAMKLTRHFMLLGVFAFMFAAGISAAMAQLHEDNVVMTGNYSEDIFVSGREVTIRAEVDAGVIAMGREVRIRSKISGDVVTMGGKVTVGDQVGGDILVAAGAIRTAGNVGGELTAVGGDIELQATVTGDVLGMGGRVEAGGRVEGDMKLAGGSVETSARVAGNLMMAGGRLEIEEAARIDGKAWAVGGRIEINGTVGKELRAAGRRVVIAGQVMGNVHVDAIDLEIGPGAKIHGKLFYRSPHKAEIHEGATILGDVAFIQSEQPAHMVGFALAAAGGIVLLVLTALIVLGAAQVLVFPGLSLASARLGAEQPWRTLGIGFAVLVATPIAAMVLMWTVIGIPLGMVVMAAYMVVLALGLGITALMVARRGLAYLGRDWDDAAWGRIGLVVIGLVVIAVIGLIPFIGAVAVVAALSIGIGGLAAQIARRRAEIHS